MNTRILLAAALATSVISACSFDFERGGDLDPGDVAGAVLLANGDVGRFARVSVDGTGRVLRADRDGRFLIKGLVEGTWALRVDYDRDGDGWPEELARRAVQIRARDGQLGFVDLGVVDLAGPAALRGVVEGPDGVAPTGASVAIVREVPLEDGEGAPFTADQSVEARVGAGPDGAFFFPALEEGPAKLRVLLNVDGELYASDDVAIEIGPGENTLDAPVVLALQPVETAGPDDAFPEGEPISQSRRLASIFVSPPAQPGERFVVQLVQTGKLPPAPDFGSPRVLGADNLTLSDVPLGVLDVYVVSDAGRQGVLFERQVAPGGSDEVIEWGLVHLELELCANDDCDEDGVPGLPPRNGVDDPLWADCRAQCASGVDFNIDAVAEGRCESGGEIYDCEDDGDGQPDATEPRCYGVGFGADRDGDGLCDPVDPFPFCRANDETCDPEDVTGQYGGPGDPPPPPDAGPPPDDAGPPPDDAGPPPVVDAGVDAGPPATPFEPPFVRKLFDTNDRFFPLNGPSAFLFDSDDRTALIAGSGDGSKKGGGGSLGTGCAVEHPEPSNARYWVASVGADGACQEIVVGGDGGFTSGASVTRDGDGFLFAAFTDATNFNVGIDAQGQPVTESTQGARIVVARIGPDLRVAAFGVVNLSLQAQGFIDLDVVGASPLGADRAAIAAVVFGSPIIVENGDPAALTVDTSAGDRAIFIELDASLQYLSGVDVGADDANIGKVLPDGAGGVLLSAFSPTTFLGLDLTAAQEGLVRLDDQLNASLVARGDRVGRFLPAVDGAGGLHAAVEAPVDPSGLHTFQPSFSPGAGNLQRVDDPSQSPNFVGAISDAVLLQAIEFDPLTGEFITVSSQGITATLHFGGREVSQRALNPTTDVDRMDLDPLNRLLFFTDSSGGLHRCSLDACAATDTVVGTVFGDFAVDPAAQRVYFGSSGFDRMDYDGNNLEPNFYGGAAPARVSVDTAAGLVWWFDPSQQLYLRGALDVANSEVNLGLSLAPVDPPDDVQVDPGAGRLYAAVNNQIYSVNYDGSGEQLVAVLGGNGAVRALVSATFPAPAVTGAGVSASLAFDAASLVRFNGAGEPSAATFATPVGGELELTQLVFSDDAAYLAGALRDGIAALDASTLEIRADNEPNNFPGEAWVARLVDDGQRFVPEWLSQSTGNGDVRLEGIGVGPDGDLLLGGRVAVEARFGPEAVGPGPFLWHLPPAGDEIPPQIRPPAGATDAFAILGGLATTAPFVVPHGNGGWLGAGPDGNGGVFVQRDDFGGTTFNLTFAGASVLALDVHDSGFFGVLLGFSDAFTFGPLSHTVNAGELGVAALVFDAGGALHASSFSALAGGGSAEEIAVRGDGSFALLLGADSDFRLEDEQASPVAGTAAALQALVATYDASGRLVAHHLGDGAPSSAGEALAATDDGATLAVVSGAVFGAVGDLTLVHLDPAGANDWNNGIELIGLQGGVDVEVAGSAGGTLAALSLAFGGEVTQVTFRTSCFTANFNTLSTNTHLVRAFDAVAQGCPLDTASLVSADGPLNDTQIRFVDGAGNLVVTGGYQGFLSLNTGTIDADAAGGGVYAAFLHAEGFGLNERALRVMDTAQSAQLEALGSYPDGRTWLRIAVGGAGDAVFSEESQTTVNFGADGVVWILDPVDDPTGYVSGR